MRRFYPKAWLAAAILVVAGACGSDSSTSPDIAAGGTWNLQQINGSALPVIIGTGTEAVTILTSVLTMSANGNYNELVTLRPAGETTNTTFTEIGTWSTANGVVTFNDQTDGIVYTGTVAGNTLTEVGQGFTSVYTR